MEQRKPNLLIRPETEADFRAVENLVREAFWNVYRPGCLEHYVIHVLRDDPAFVKALDFVMELDGRLIGQNVFMKTHIDAIGTPIMATTLRISITYRTTRSTLCRNDRRSGDILEKALAFPIFFVTQPISLMPMIRIAIAAITRKTALTIELPRKASIFARKSGFSDPAAASSNKNAYLIPPPD